MNRKINLRDEALTVAGFDKPEYKKAWVRYVRYVTGIDEDKTGFFLFGGNFVPYGMIDFPTKTHVLLCAAKSDVYCYRFLTVNPAGAFVTHLEGSARFSGWEVRIRQKVEKLLLKVIQDNNIAAIANTADDYTEDKPLLEPLTSEKNSLTLAEFDTRDLLVEMGSRGFLCMKQDSPNKNVAILFDFRDPGFYTIKVKGEDWGSFTDKNLIDILREKAETSKDKFEFFIKTYRLGVSQETP